MSDVKFAVVKETDIAEVHGALHLFDTEEAAWNWLLNDYVALIENPPKRIFSRTLHIGDKAAMVEFDEYIRGCVGVSWWVKKVTELHAKTPIVDLDRSQEYAEQLSDVVRYGTYKMRGVYDI